MAKPNPLYRRGITGRCALFAVTLLLTVVTVDRAEASFINYSTKEINLKIVYAGPNAEANAATVRYIFGRTAPDVRGKLIELAAGDAGKVLFFDFVPKGLGTIRGFKIRFHLYTIDGPTAPATRRLLLKGADGCVFVADARSTSSDANRRALATFTEDLASHGDDIAAFPLAVQLDAFGAERVIGADAFRKTLPLGDRPIVGANSKTGDGVFSALKAAAKLTVLELKKRPSSPPK